MKKELTNQEKEEQEIANIIQKAIYELEQKRDGGVSLEKSHYIRDVTDRLKEELAQLKTPKH